MMKSRFHVVRSRLATAIGLTTALTAILWMGVPAGAAGPGTERVNVSSTGEEANDASFPGYHSISGDGRFVTFASAASNLVVADTNEAWDLFRRDRSTGQTIRLSISSAGEQANDHTFNTESMSPDGNLVAFDSPASNLVPKDTNRRPDVFVRDVLAATTTRVSVTSEGKQAQGESFGPSISADGRVVVFSSEASLVPGDTNRRVDVYAHNLATGQTSLISTSSTGKQGNDDSFGESVSADGRFVTFGSFADNMVPGDTNGALDIFLRDTLTGQTTLLSVSSAGQQGDGDSFNSVITPDGRFVAFSSFADNLVRRDANGFGDAFVRDLKTGKTTLVSKSSTGEQGNDDSCCSKGISGDGRFVAYRSFASNLVPGDTNATGDVFVADRDTGSTVIASVSSAGEVGNDESFNAGISQDGTWVLLGSLASNLVPNDTNGVPDVFVRGPFGSLQGLAAAGPTRTSAASSPARASQCRELSSLQRYMYRLGAAARAACAL